jgi:hypothetical protein
MGDITYRHAQHRVRSALEQRLEAADTPTETRATYDDAIDRLLRIAIDEEELDRLAADLAIDVTTIDWPDDTNHHQ